jgi:hypothetical protein
VPFPHWLRFAYHYFIKAGFLDGWHGYVFCHLLAEYEFWISVRRMELRSQAKLEHSPAGQLKVDMPPGEGMPLTAAAEAREPVWLASSRERR